MSDVLLCRGESLEELAFEQGRLTAQVRGASLEDDRRHVEARSGTPFDVFARRSLLADTARAAFERMDASSRAFFAAYADGVDAGLDAADRTEGRWQPWTPVGVFGVHHVLFGSLGHHLWRRHVAHQLGDGAVEALAQEVPALSGSNAWVVGGDRTASGRPLIGADPHRMLTVPGVYQRVHLVCPSEGVDVLGLTIAGVPGVQHFGHTGGVAWAITNAMADTQDVLDVRLRHHDGGVQADLGLGWEECETGPDDVVVTRLGPVVVGGADEREGLVLRTVPWVTRDWGLSAVLPLLRARTVADVSAALDGWVEPVNDVLAADTTGAVIHRVAGRVPRRVEGDWIGWLEHEVERVPTDGHVVSANHRRGPESAALSNEFAPPHRARRLEQLLAEHPVLDVPTAAALHADTLLLPARDWQRRLATLDVEGATGEVRDVIVAWDGRMDADSSAAAVFAAVRAAAVRRLAATPPLDRLGTPSDLPVLFAPWLRPEPRVALALDRWLVDGVPFGVDLDAVLVEALEEVAGAEIPATWGDVHRFERPDGTSVPLAGDDGCVLSTSAATGVGDAVWRGPVARLVWCLADRDASRWTVPDEVDVWASGATSPVGGTGVGS